VFHSRHAIPPAAYEARKGDHEPEAARRTVLVTVTPDDAGTATALTIIHGPRGDGPAEAASRAEHREGWEFFLPRLAAQLS
jgi:uncharacterized protein YndB with AHSA1/START domain